jgi:hypothetical protein
MLGLVGLSVFLACSSGASDSGTLTNLGDVGDDGGSASGSNRSGSGSSSSGHLPGDKGGAPGSSGSHRGSSTSGSHSGGSSGSHSGGSGSSGSSTSGSISSSGLSTGGTAPGTLPTPKGTCAPLTTGSQSITLNGKAMTWSIWVGQKKTSGSGGPIVIYWHATGTNSQEVTEALGSSAISEIQSMGGVVASAESTTSTGTNTGNGVWYTGDFDYSDEIIACANQQFKIDAKHIHAAGYSAGALQTATMFYSRASFLASVTVFSGGNMFPAQSDDPSNHIPVLAAHGEMSAGDFLAQSTTTWESSVKSAGSFIIDCDDGQTHVDIARLTNLAPSTWQFFKDHPFGIGSPDPYAKGLPSGFESICKIL